MSKYQLENLLNEITGTGRIGTYIATYRELVNKVDELEEKGIRVKELGMSGDGKTAFEFEIYPGDKDEAFSVYPYKFDPRDEDEMQEFPFSIGGKPVAIRVAKELLGQGAYSNAEIKAGKDELKSTGDKIPAGFEESEKKELPKSIADKEKAEIEKDAKKAKGMMDEMQNADYDLLKMKKEIRMQLDSFDKGIIDGDDLANALEEIVFGEIKPPGMNSDADFEREQRMQMSMRENGHVDDYKEEIAETDVDVDLVKATAAKANNQITNAAGMADFILDVIKQIGEKEQEGILNNNNIKQAVAFLEKAAAQVKENHAMQGVEAELESGEIGNMDALTEEISEKDIIKALKAANAQDYEIEVYMKSLKKSGDKFDEVDDYVEDFNNYVADKALQEHFSRFMFKKYS